MRSIVVTKMREDYLLGLRETGIFFPNDEVNVPIACILALVGPPSSWFSETTEVELNYLLDLNNNNNTNNVQ